MVGLGLKKVALLADHTDELQHFMLARLLKRGNLPREHFFLGTASEHTLVTDIQREGIQVVVPMGDRALGQLLGHSGMERWRGRIAPFQHDLGRPVWVVPTFAPSKLLARKGEEDLAQDVMRHPPRFHGVWMRDVQKAVQIAERGFTRMPVTYLEDPPAELFAQFADEYEAALRADPATMLSWDIETPYKQKESDEEELEATENLLDGIILRISFSFRPGYAVSVRWASTYLPTIIRLLASRGVSVVWNGSTFDVPVVESAGYRCLGHIHDYMDAYHLLESDLPKGLEWVSAEATDMLPWKHLAQVEGKAAFYSASDADVALRNALYIKAKLMERGQWDLYINHVVRLMPLLAAAGKRGNLMDLEKRGEIRTKLLAMKQALVEEAQAYVPKALHPRTLYKTQPDEVVGAFPLAHTMQPLTVVGHWDVIYERSTEKVCSACGEFASNKTEHFKGSLGPPHPKTGKPTRVKNPCKEAGAEIRPQAAWAPRFYRIEDFNPNSSDQLKAYMRFQGHPIGKDKRDSTKETADASHLKFLVKKYGKKFPLYALTLQLHKAIKTIGTYTPEPDPEGFLHTQYVNSTSTWRFGARKTKFGTQIQNWGKREDNPYAKEARKQIIARPGHRLVQIDSSAVEAVMQGYYMNDPTYMALASKSIHAWLACRALNLEFTPENVDRVKAEHESLYLKMKVTNYLCCGPAHEVLTPAGWVALEHYEGQPLCQWAPDGQMSFKPALHYVNKPFDGDLFVLDNKFIQAEVTEKHAFPAQKCWQAGAGYERTIVDVLNSNYNIPITGVLATGTPYDEKALRLLVAIQADGHIVKSGGVQFTLRKERKIERLVELLSGRAYKKKHYGPNTVFYINADNIADVVSLLDDKKTFNEAWLLGLDETARRVFVEELPLWDGGTKENGDVRRVYRSMNGRNAEVVQTIIHTVGKRCTVSQSPSTQMWSASIVDQNVTSPDKPTRRPYKGNVYCVTTDTGYFLYRYKGVIAVSGNTNFGGGDFLLWQTFPEQFPTRADATRAQDSLYALLPTLKAYHHSVRWEAHTKTYLTTPWGYRHSYYDVFKPNPDGAVGLGKDAKRCVAFKPQNSNGAFQKDNLLLIGATPIEGEPLTDIEAVTANWDEHQQHIDAGETWARFMPTNISVHDSACLDTEEQLVERCAAMQLAIFTRPIPQMHGLRIGAEVEVGVNWGAMSRLDKVVIESYTMKETEAGAPALAA